MCFFSCKFVIVVGLEFELLNFGSNSCGVSVIKFFFIVKLEYIYLFICLIERYEVCKVKWVILNVLSLGLGFKDFGWVRLGKLIFRIFILFIFGFF